MGGQRDGEVEGKMQEEKSSKISSKFMSGSSAFSLKSTLKTF